MARFIDGGCGHEIPLPDDWDGRSPVTVACRECSNVVKIAAMIVATPEVARDFGLATIVER